jgi:hypothetical protein
VLSELGELPELLRVKACRWEWDEVPVSRRDVRGVVRVRLSSGMAAALAAVELSLSKWAG